MASPSPARDIVLPARSPVSAATATAGADGVDRAMLWPLAAGLAWGPWWYGSNDLIAWGINAVLFPGLAAFYELSLLARGRGHPVGIRYVLLPAAMFAVVVTWAAVQCMALPGGWAAEGLQHPGWRWAAEALGRQIPGSISADPDATTLALAQLLTAAAVFWLALQLSRDSAVALLLLRSVVAIGCAYSAFGLIEFAFELAQRGPAGGASSAVRLTANFLNHNAFASYAGLALVAAVALAMQRYRRALAGAVGPRHAIAAMVEASGRAAAVPLAAVLLLAAGVLLTGSRGAAIATASGLIVAVLLLRRDTRQRSATRRTVAIAAGAAAAAIMLANADLLTAALADKGVFDADRLAVGGITLRSILDAPLTGHGYGTFSDVFPLYRDGSVSVQGAWEQAHNTYLEVLQGLGLPVGGLLIGAVAILALRCAAAARQRREAAVVPAVGAGCAVLIGIHALVDFSIQIQAVAVSFAALLGAGMGQSASSRLSLSD